MIDWLNATTTFNEVEQQNVAELRAEAQENIEAWNEEDLKMNFIAFIIRLAGLKSTTYIRTFYEKSVEATVNGYFLKTKTDFMIAKGVLDLVKVPYFHFQEYTCTEPSRSEKDRDPNGDPIAQLVEAFLIAQEKNKNGKPLLAAM